jgi:protein-ribulosamine 3-kinase
VSLPTEAAFEAARRFGEPLEKQPVGGGCIHPALRVSGPRGRGFLKLGGAAPRGALEVEARGLEWLDARAGGALRLPRVLARGAGAEPWLLLEWLEPAPAPDAAWAALGRGLAELHRAADGGWGWEHDGFIGPLGQDNGAEDGWAAFWMRRRLGPQRRIAEESGTLPGAEESWEALDAALPDLLAVAEEEGPSPLHGDLWGGNAHAMGDGGVALVDPAPYRGHREVDLAMARLFGGFPAVFFAAYEEAWPLRAAGVERRCACYQLYYLLVHLNLFGHGYAPGTERALHRVLAG